MSSTICRLIGAGASASRGSASWGTAITDVESLLSALDRAPSSYGVDARVP